MFLDYFFVCFLLVLGIGAFQKTLFNWLTLESRIIGGVGHYITYVYTIDIPTKVSHRDNMCFVFTSFIVIAQFFFFMMDYFENGYSHSKM